MGLKCKLQKSVQPSIVEKSDKVLVGFFQSFSIFNSSQLFFLASFLSLIGFLIWFSQPISSEESDCAENSEDQSSSSTSSSKKSLQDDTSKKSVNTIKSIESKQHNHEDEDRSQDTSNHQKTTRDSLRGAAPRYQIDTIYEGSNENLHAAIQEKPQMFNANVSKMLESAIVHDHRNSEKTQSDKMNAKKRKLSSPV